MGTWDTCTQEPSALLRWIECHPGTAGYIQAVGTVLAVIGALCAPRVAAWLEERRLDADQKRRTNLLLETLVVPTMEVGNRAERIEAAIDEQRAHPPSEEIWDSWFDATIYLKPPLRFEFLHQSLEGVDADRVAPFRAVAYAIVLYNSARSMVKDDGRPDASENWRYQCGALTLAISEVIKSVHSAQVVSMTVVEAMPPA